MLIRNNAVDLYTAAFDEVLLANFNERVQIMPKVFKVKTDKTKEVKTSSMSGTGIWTEYYEGQGAPEEDMVQMYDETFTHLKYGKKFSVSHEALEDDEYAVVKKMDTAAQMGMGGNARVETIASNIFNNAFTTNGADGTTLCSDSHPKNPDEATTYLDNKSTNTLTHDNLEAMEIQISTNLQNPKGLQITIPRRAMLLVPVALNGTAQRIVNERADYVPVEFTHSIDIYAGEGRGSLISYTVVPWEYLTSTTAWFVVFNAFGGLRWYWREKANFKGWNDEDNEKIWFRGRMRSAAGWTGDGWRDVFGSTGV